MRDQSAPRAQTLDAGDPGASRSKWVALALVLALAAWMASGFVWPATKPEPESPVAQLPRAVSVATRTSFAEPVTEYLSAEGQAQPDRIIMVRSEASGEIAAIEARKGDQVAEGDVIARIDPAERQAALARAEQELRRAERENWNVQALLERGVATADRLAETRTALAAARAEVAAAEEALENTTIRAPFDGRLEALGIEKGEFVAAGEDVAQVIDAAPLTVVIEVPQQSLSSLELGLPAEVAFITGDTRMGELVFIGRSADVATRTFRAEVEVANEQDPVPAGVSADVRIPTGETVAHFLSPATLSLGADGTLGVKTVGAENRVEFHEVAIVRAQTDGIWVSGLPDEARIITVGQGYVNAGETVAPTDEAVLDTRPVDMPGSEVAGNAAAGAAEQGE